MPHPAQISLDEKTRTLKREGVPLQLNPFDRAAVVEAARLRDRNGGEVVAMTMGPPAAEEALREALALGADRGIHLTDRAFAVADTIGTSRTLAPCRGTSWPRQRPAWPESATRPCVGSHWPNCGSPRAARATPP